jgi:hypothetical protein
MLPDTLNQRKTTVTAFAITTALKLAALTAKKTSNKVANRKASATISQYGLTPRLE